MIRLWNVPGAVSTCKRALAVRRTAGEAEALIGDAEVNLGFAFFFEGRLLRARRLIATGLERLEQAQNWTFAAGALKKLGLVYCRSWRRAQGLEELRRAYVIAQEHGIDGQRHQIEKLYRQYSGKEIG